MFYNIQLKTLLVALVPTGPSMKRDNHSCSIDFIWKQLILGRCRTLGEQKNKKGLTTTVKKTHAVKAI